MLNLIFMLIAVAGAGLSIYFALKTPSGGNEDMSAHSHPHQPRKHNEKTMTEPEILTEITARIVREPDGKNRIEVTCSEGKPFEYIGLLEAAKQFVVKEVTGSDS